MQFTKFIIIGILTIISTVVDRQSIADIYTYTDARGVTYYTNIPTSPKYNFKMREVRFDYQRLSSGTYSALINNMSIKHKVDPLLVKAIIKAESDFNLKAVSSKGAKGLMQLMPGTADDMGVNNVFEPEDNIEGGVKYIKRLMGIFKSDLRLVIAAYNAGENAVIKYRGIPPFRETKQYVDKVLNYLYAYERNGVQVANE